jgi:hypothetical protein
LHTLYQRLICAALTHLNDCSLLVIWCLAVQTS